MSGWGGITNLEQRDFKHKDQEATQLETARSEALPYKKVFPPSDFWSSCLKSLPVPDSITFKCYIYVSTFNGCKYHQRILIIYNRYFVPSLFDAAKEFDH